MQPRTGLLPNCMISDSTPFFSSCLAISESAVNVLPFLLALPFNNNTFIFILVLPNIRIRVQNYKETSKVVLLYGSKYVAGEKICRIKNNN
jgi:hypothetical protein